MEPLLVDVPEHIETPRLVLRVPRAGDGAVLNRAVLESLEALRPWMPWAREAPTAAASEVFVRGAAARFIERSEFVYTVWLPEDQGGRLIGSTGMHHVDWTLRRFEIGYWLHPAHGGRGYATEAVQAMATLAFDTLQAVRVQICMDERNRRSARVAERAGFTLEGVLRCDALDVYGGWRDTRVYARVKPPA
jgi:RimJ/RimL family protein N-acetyltransferase